VVVRDGAELTALVARCLAEPRLATDLGRRAREIVAAQRGARACTMHLLAGLMTDASGRHAA
jgi:hypothetical protein